MSDPVVTAAERLLDLLSAENAALLALDLRAAAALSETKRTCVDELLGLLAERQARPLQNPVAIVSNAHAASVLPQARRVARPWDGESPTGSAPRRDDGERGTPDRRAPHAARTIAEGGARETAPSTQGRRPGSTLSGQDRLSESAPEPSRTAGDAGGLGVRLATAIEENKTLLRRAITVQQGVIAIVARAAPVSAGGCRYGASGAAAARAIMPVAISARA